MKQTLAVKLAPSSEQVVSLLATMARFNAACDAIAAIAFRERCASKFALQKIVYHDIRRDFRLPAQMTIRAISKVVEAYKRDKTKQPRFRPTGAVPYDQRIMAWRGLAVASLLTLDGRQIVPVRLGAHQQARIDRRQGQADLVERNGVFFLYVTLDVPDVPPGEPEDFLGIDLGVTNIAVDSDGTVYTGATVNGVRRRHRRLRAKRGIALEELKGIRSRVRVSRPQRATLHSWSFGQLRQVIAYKAALAGVPVVYVDPRNTSRICPVCGCVDKAHRRSQSEFSCTFCGFAGLADAVAAVVIGRRGAVNHPYCPDADAPSVAPGQNPRR